VRGCLPAHSAALPQQRGLRQGRATREQTILYWYWRAASNCLWCRGARRAHARHVWSSDRPLSAAVSFCHMRWKAGDLVWCRVQSYPSWPGQVMDPSTALLSVRHAGQPGQTLVSFFGDSSYGWFDPSQPDPFMKDFGKKSTAGKSKVRHPVSGDIPFPPMGHQGARLMDLTACSDDRRNAVLKCTGASFRVIYLPDGGRMQRPATSSGI
jgi:hypothetical protein